MYRDSVAGIWTVVLVSEGKTKNKAFVHQARTRAAMNRMHSQFWRVEQNRLTRRGSDWSDVIKKRLGQFREKAKKAGRERENKREHSEMSDKEE